MRRWGIVITLFYAVVVVVLLPPAWQWLRSPTVDIFGAEFVSGLSHDLGWVYRNWFVWAWAGILVSGQAMLLVLSADTSWRRAEPRQYRTVTVITIALLAALLTNAGFWSLSITVFEVFRAAGTPEGVIKSVFGPLFAISPLDRTPDIYYKHLGWWLGLWVIWGGALHRYIRVASLSPAAAVSELFKGSLLVLLLAASARIAIEASHGWWFADAYTAFYIVTGIAVMLLCFGPGVLALYKKKYDVYRKINAGAQ